MTETVYVPTVSNRSSKNLRYHTDKDCKRLRDTVKEIDKAQVEKKGIALCAFCAGDVDHPTEHRRSLRAMVNNGEIDL